LPPLSELWKRSFLFGAEGVHIEGLGGDQRLREEKPPSSESIATKRGRWNGTSGRTGGGGGKKKESDNGEKRIEGKGRRGGSGGDEEWRKRSGG